MVFKAAIIQEFHDLFDDTNLDDAERNVGALIALQITDGKHATEIKADSKDPQFHSFAKIHAFVLFSAQADYSFDVYLHAARKMVIAAIESYVKGEKLANVEVDDRAKVCWGQATVKVFKDKDAVEGMLAVIGAMSHTEVPEVALHLDQNIVFVQEASRNLNEDIEIRSLTIATRACLLDKDDDAIAKVQLDSSK